MRNASCFARQHYCTHVKSLYPEPVCLRSNPASATCRLSLWTQSLNSLHFRFLLCETGMVIVLIPHGNFGKPSELLHLVFEIMPGL